MPAPFVAKDLNGRGLILDIRKVVNGTNGWNGKDCYEFCMGEENLLGENTRTYRVQVSNAVADEIAMFLTK